ncbi:hypothetical protein [Yoonia vestfoldensis]|uniref:Arc-like DNA binding domain protein n=1 Tax=Yoonia vestfoldensis TaxID=245188 RepID=A0A1Y0EGA5_9RHOB|nr:hypothetical protein [Yoonia vestfoldensis]ARU02653.1 hypothetical protein LOKVESSMR4R_03381 [Yoonia vestfoldensis]
MARDDGYTRYTVRIPTPLYERVKAAAGEKSVNAEIVEALEAAYPAPNQREVVLDVIVLLADLQRQMKEAGGAEADLQALKSKCDEVIAQLKKNPDLAGEEGAQTEFDLALLLAHFRT